MGLLRDTWLTQPVNCFGFDVLNSVAMIPRPRCILSPCMRRLCIPWVIAPVKALVGVVRAIPHSVSAQRGWEDVDWLLVSTETVEDSVSLLNRAMVFGIRL